VFTTSHCAWFCYGTSNETKYKGRCTVIRRFDAIIKEHQHPIEIGTRQTKAKQTWKSLITFMKENCCGKCCLGYRKTHGSYNNNLTTACYRLEIVILDDHSKVFLLSKKNGIKQTPLFIPTTHHSENYFMLYKMRV
jgi:hypothetical protein